MAHHYRPDAGRAYTRKHVYLSTEMVEAIEAHGAKEELGGLSPAIRNIVNEWLKRTADGQKIAKAVGYGE
jgi:hypothetical protein